MSMNNSSLEKKFFCDKSKHLSGIRNKYTTAFFAQELTKSDLQKLQVNTEHKQMICRLYLTYSPGNHDFMTASVLQRYFSLAVQKLIKLYETYCSCASCVSVLVNNT
jgi:hypothetical protein